jgi:phosphoribosylanthranilate isomerase
VAPNRAAELVDAAPPFLSTVLVALPDSATRAVELAGAVAPDAIQLHGDFDGDDLRYVRRETRADVITAVDAADADRARGYDGVADAILLDSTTESGAGGTGETHDWRTARDLVAALSTPVVLAGGLTPANVAEAARTVEPYAVDVASGVERAGGRKDHDAVAAFVRNADAEVPP